MKLRDIVETWNPNENPEFRGFRCGLCQKSIKKAYHHTLNSKEYVVPVHLCENCQETSNIKGGEYKAFSCDKCGTEFTEAWHVWNNKDGRLVENHYCKPCGTEIL